MAETKLIPILETERLILFPWKLEYAKDMLTFASNENVVSVSDGWKLIDDVKKAQKKIKNFIDKSAHEWAIAMKQNGKNKIIGAIGLRKDILKTSNYKLFGISHGELENDKMIVGFGYLLAEEYWGQGIATEAAKRIIDYSFSELKCDVIQVHHRVYNHRSKRVIEKCNFKFRGTFPRNNQNAPDSKSCYYLLRDNYIK